MAVSDEQHLLMTFPEDKIAHQTRVTLPGITAQSLGRKSDDTDQSCLSSNSLKVSKNITPILESLIIEFNQIALLTHTNNFKIEFFLGLLEGLTPPKAASCFSKLYNLCSHRSEVKLLSQTLTQTRGRQDQTDAEPTSYHTAFPVLSTPRPPHYWQ